MRCRRGIAALLAFTTTACTTWARQEPLLTEPVPQRERVQIWIGDESYAVHGVVVRGDTIFAVPYWLSPSCDSCRVRFAASQVDSVRVSDGSTGGTLAAILGGLVIIFLFTWHPPREAT